MTQADTDKLVDELIYVKERYADVAAALGFDDVSDPGDYHFEIVARAKELAAFARVA
jgi:hypothetical protein